MTLACRLTAESIVGESAAVRRLRTLIAVAAPTQLPVLVQGPTGAGKELVAAALHAASGRRGRFVPFNVCAIGDSMFEDALFGHVRGAYTGAFTDAPGFLREADGGTVFLDEVSGLQPMLQVKLLRAIETGEFRPIGAKHDVHSEFRVVTATNERLEQLIAEHRFRVDLAHRIGGVVIDVPPLAERLEDIPLLVRHFLDRAGAAHVSVTPEALARLCAHDWPGNVRELKKTVEWAAALIGEELAPEAVDCALAQWSHAAPANDSIAVERQLLRHTLERHHWNTLSAARELGVHRATLYRRMKRLRLAVPPETSARHAGEMLALMGHNGGDGRGAAQHRVIERS
jgi:two-component system NtrC family response regulator